MTEWLHFHFSLSCIGEGNDNPLQCSCLENPRDGGACWASVYGVTQSRTRLKRLSSSSSSLFWSLCLNEQVICIEQSLCANHLPGNPHIWDRMNCGEFLRSVKGERTRQDIALGLFSTWPSQKSRRGAFWFHSQTHHLFVKHLPSTKS